MNSSPQNQDHRRWKASLIGFYLSCAGVSLGAAVGGGGYFFFESIGWLIFGGCLSLVSSITCFYSLAASRRAPTSR